VKLRCERHDKSTCFIGVGKWKPSIKLVFKTLRLKIYLFMEIVWGQPQSSGGSREAHNSDIQLKRKDVPRNNTWQCFTISLSVLMRQVKERQHFHLPKLFLTTYIHVRHLHFRFSTTTHFSYYVIFTIIGFSVKSLLYSFLIENIICWEYIIGTNSIILSTEIRIINFLKWFL